MKPGNGLQSSCGDWWGWFRFGTIVCKPLKYRPLVKQHCYFDHMLVAGKCQQDKIFPFKNTDNCAICVSGKGSKNPFSILMVNCMPDFHFGSESQFFPRYHFIHKKASPFLNEDSKLERVDNVTDKALDDFRSHYQDYSITKDDIFDYVYGVLHAADYRDRCAIDLAKSLPRIPYAPDFQAFVKAGQTLATLRLNYETGPQYPLVSEITGVGPLFTKSMSLSKDKSTLKVSNNLSIKGIPLEADRYEVHGRTPIGWFIDRYRITKDDDSRIVNDSNAWFPDSDAFIAAVSRIVHLSVETVRIVEGLPRIFEE